MSSRSENFPALLEKLRPECEAIIARYERPRSALLPLIHLFQQHEGYASAEAQRAVAEMLELSPAVVESTVSFYTLFFRKPVGKYMLQVCRGLACSINGAEDIMAYLREKLGVGHLQTTDDGMFSYEEVECLAACDRATCMQVNLEFVYDLTPQMIDEMIDAMRAGTYAVAPMAQTDKPQRTWKVVQDTQVSHGGKSIGAVDQPNPNNGGGIDKDGVIMLDRIRTQEARFVGRTKERLVNSEPAITEIIRTNGESH
jgi:NADH-quinone oxidoreductase subunit E